jgi:hypothetical protein
MDEQNLWFTADARVLKKTASVGRVIFSGSFLSLITRQQNPNYKCQVYFDPKKSLSVIR